MPITTQSTQKRDSMDVTPSSPTSKPTIPTPRNKQQRTHTHTLTSLPPSVRNKIYHHTLNTAVANLHLPNVTYTHTVLPPGTITLHASRPPFPVATPLFHLNKAISHDALAYFYATNLFVRLALYTDNDAWQAAKLLQESGLLFYTAGHEVLARCTRHAMDVVLEEVEGEGKSRQLSAMVMFPAVYLPRLVHFLDKAGAAWTQRQHLTVTVRNGYGECVSRVQGELLEPFRLLTKLGRVTVEPGNVLPRYAEGLAACMMRVAFEVEGWLRVVTELADLADGAREKGEDGLATEYGQSVIIALTYGYLSHGEALHSHEGDAFHKAVQRLRWRTELGVGISLSLLHRAITTSRDWHLTHGGGGVVPNVTPAVRRAARDLLHAETALSAALSLATDSPSPTHNPWFQSLPVELIPPNKPGFFTDSERAQTWYALGTVHTVLGEYLFACGDFERALELWGGQEGRERVEAGFDKARRGVDGDVEGMWEGKVGPGSGLRRAAVVARGV